MALRVRSLFSGLTAGNAARQSADAQFCDGCAQVCDASCRAEAQRRRSQLSVSLYR
ncbi:hypothetical protein P8605_08250 [Streptomyces sp. T-3]|nr:hypothetical protein [Streptomyces sp. T-3]